MVILCIFQYVVSKWSATDDSHEFQPPFKGQLHTSKYIHSQSKTESHQMSFYKTVITEQSPKSHFEIAYLSLIGHSAPSTSVMNGLINTSLAVKGNESCYRCHHNSSTEQIMSPGQKHSPTISCLMGSKPVNHLFYFIYFMSVFFSLYPLSGVWLVVMDSVLDRSLLDIPRAAAGNQPSAHLLCHPAGTRHDHGEDIVCPSRTLLRNSSSPPEKKLLFSFF